MIVRHAFYRKGTDVIIKILSTVSACIGILFLVWILWEVSKRGIGALGINFFTKLPTPPGIEGGGVANALLGTVIITLLATVMGVPVGVMSGVYLSEFGKSTLLGKSVRFTLNVIMGVPSIIVGLFVYTLLVLPFGHFSGYAGAVSLAIIMLPVVARTTEDMLTMVPNELRESALAVGAPQWKVILGIVFRAAKSGMLTGILLAIARVSGETAPLLFTALNSPYWPQSINQPTANLTVTIFNYAMSPFSDWQQIAWGASFLIMMVILLLTILTRMIAREKI
ncbi:MAG: phosphate ABC transporter permease PstA [Candidatus Latescibacteria bacterium]|jgi:phosphate transport system permease protein|nr:phosphate ABC transporter permease PstA [Candidatus Latescibacterota bacterium]